MNMQAGRSGMRSSAAPPLQAINPPVAAAARKLNKCPKPRLNAYVRPKSFPSAAIAPKNAGYSQDQHNTPNKPPAANVP